MPDLASRLSFNPCVGRNSSGASSLRRSLLMSVSFNPCVGRNSSGAGKQLAGLPQAPHVSIRVLVGIAQEPVSKYNSMVLTLLSTL